MQQSAALTLHDVSLDYASGSNAVRAVDRLSLRVDAGEFVAVMGPSGSGKSTLLALAAGLTAPTEGTVQIAGVDLAALSDDGLTTLRRDRVGFVFQQYNLVPTLSAIDNIRLPFRLARRQPDHARIDALVQRLGIADRLDHRPGALSGGQQQRVAITRALATSPAIVFADEPTGALDAASAQAVLDLLQTEARAGQAMVIVTHDPLVAERADRVVFLADGRVSDARAGLGADAIATCMIALSRQQSERAA